MSNKKDYYEILGVDKNASVTELKSAYRKLAMKWHPDRQAGKSDAEKQEATRKFQEISDAYSILSDPDKRRRYDEYGDEGAMDGNSGGIDPFEMFRKMAGNHFGFGDFGGFGNFGGFGREEENSEPDFDSPEDGRDVQTRISVSFRESVFGGTREFDLDLDNECPKCHGHGIKAGSKPKKCPHCGGRGHIVQTQCRGAMIVRNVIPCQHCRGTGYEVEYCDECGGSKRVRGKRHIKVRIPAGAYTGMNLRLKELGQCGVNGGSNGDLYLALQVDGSSIFERVDGFDLETKAYISPARASLGGDIEIDTPHGVKTVNVKPGTCCGDSTTIPGCGIVPDHGNPGSLRVVFEIEPYTRVSDEQRKLLEKLAKTETQSNFAKASKKKKAVDDFISGK